MINSTLCYIEKGGAYLMLYRNKKKLDVNGGKWVGVGGKFEKGETPDECVLREAFEETGLTLTNYHLHGIIEFHSDIWEDENMYLYSATKFTGELKNDCLEGDLSWVKKEDILNLPMWSGDIYFLKELLSGKENISMKLFYEGEELVKIER